MYAHRPDLNGIPPKSARSQLDASHKTHGSRPSSAGRVRSLRHPLLVPKPSVATFAASEFPPPVRGTSDDRVLFQTRIIRLFRPGSLPWMRTTWTAAAAITVARRVRGHPRSGSGVGVVLMGGVAGGLELEGGVFHADGEVLADAVLKLVEELVRVTPVEALVFHNDVRGEDR